jgi:hypothetical protein
MLSDRNMAMDKIIENTLIKMIKIIGRTQFAPTIYWFWLNSIPFKALTPQI